MHWKTHNVIAGNVNTNHMQDIIMGSFTEIICTGCNFKMLLGGCDQFYVKGDELVEYMPLMLTEIESREISGHIDKTYCPDCAKIVKTYVIKESDYAEDESISKVEAFLEKKDISEMESIELLCELQEYDKILQKLNDKIKDVDNGVLDKFKSDEHILTIIQFENDGDMICCPGCERKLKRKFNEEKCPMCGGELAFGRRVNLD